MTEMHNEVVEAVIEHYKGIDEDIAADCLVYLSSLKHLQLSVAATMALESMGRCYNCGCKLLSYTHKEVHDELEEKPEEIITEIYCPQCDIRTGGYYV